VARRLATRGAVAGKSTLARTLDLLLHPIDLETHDHAARLNRPTRLDEQLAHGPAPLSR
jgi:hypothetical protein